MKKVLWRIFETIKNAVMIFWLYKFGVFVIQNGNGTEEMKWRC